MMVRGTVLFLALLSGNTPREAVENTWAAIQDGSPRTFLSSLIPGTSEAILDSCSAYLDSLRTFSQERLGEVFASIRLEAAPDEVQYWEPMSVLEMVMSSPEHHGIVNDTDIVVDSILTRDSTAVVHITVTPPSGLPENIIIHTEASPLGWRVGGLEPIAGSVLETTIGL